ncbi:hypothetical protein L596_013735 [Steinernema carpocapsae]|uniref:Uncharacterized protein n=1 Tax=Steinernema carpocapsae TaxID=34508 RepID=A0A4U5P118_STECR|nr:hypothetical protein L596_013735 [Steinernema carpocapsae]
MSFVEKKLKDLKDRDELRKVNVLVKEDKDEIVSSGPGTTTLRTVTSSVIRDKEDLEDSDYIPVSSMFIDDISVYNNISDQRWADVAKVLKLPCTGKLRETWLVFECDSLSAEHFEILKLLAEKPLEDLTIDWKPKKGLFWNERKSTTSEEAISAAKNAFGQLFAALRGTLTRISFDGPFSLVEFMRWVNHNKIKHVCFTPKHESRFVADDPQARLKVVPSLIEVLKMKLRKCKYEIRVSNLYRQGFDIFDDLRTKYAFRDRMFWSTFDYRTRVKGAPWNVCVKLEDLQKVTAFSVLSIECFVDWD